MDKTPTTAGKDSKKYFNQKETEVSVNLYKNPKIKTTKKENIEVGDAIQILYGI